MMEEKKAGYKDLLVWKEGIALVEKVYAITKNFPKEEVYGLTSQIRRAAVSVPSNIAEGNTRKNKKEFQQYLFVSLGSLSEIDTQWVISTKLGYVTEDCYRELSERINKLRAMILNLIRSLDLPRGSWVVDRGARDSEPGTWDSVKSEASMKKRMSLQDKAEEAMKRAVQEVVERHKKTGRPLAVWEKGRVCWISPFSVKK